MDINTPKGQETVQQELECIELFEKQNPQLKYIHTDKTKPIPFDGLIVKNNVLHAIVETKCRLMSESTLTTEYNNEWLVTFDKLVKCAEASKMLQVPLIGFLYLVNDGLLLVKKITNDNGEFVCGFCCYTSKTQATVNGGEAFRMNAFLDMKDATRILR